MHFFIDGNVPGQLALVGDGLLPADFDGTRLPAEDATIPIVGTQDDGGGYGATFDAAEHLQAVDQVEIDSHGFARSGRPTPRRVVRLDLPVRADVPATACRSRGSPTRQQFLDILSYRQRPTFRLAYRNFGSYEALVTNQSVEALPGVAGVRWYEIRRTNGTYSIYQQGTYVPNDGVHRWMGCDRPGRQRRHGRSATASSTARPSFPASATRAVSSGIRSDR